jgi:hypothetical protein
MLLNSEVERGDLVEKCMLCDAAVPFTRQTTAQCEAGHMLPRCAQTQLVLDSFEYWECSLCKSLTRPHLPRPQWLELSRPEGFWCFFCDMPCNLVNS